MINAKNDKYNKKTLKYIKLLIRICNRINNIQNYLQECVKFEVGYLLLCNLTLDNQTMNDTVKESKTKYVTIVTIRLRGNICKRYPHYIEHYLPSFKVDLLEVSCMLQHRWENGFKGHNILLSPERLIWCLVHEKVVYMNYLLLQVNLACDLVCVNNTHKKDLKIIIKNLLLTK